MIMQNKNKHGSRQSIGNMDLLHHGTPFSLRLTAHASCVNALVWSGSGRWLATAGDDTKVALWDFHPTEPVLAAPDIFSGSLANILRLAFTLSNRHILSGSTDGRILQYDITRPSSLAATPRSCAQFIAQSDGCIRDIAPSPSQDGMFIAASEDGLVTAYDTRVPSSASASPRGVGELSLDSEATGVQFHPHMENVFVTSDGRGTCKLWDTRTAFSSDQKQKQSKRSLLQYVTKISKPGRSKLSSPEASSVTFDATGTKLAITMLNFFPTIYNLGDEWPIAICSATSSNKTKLESAAEESSSSSQGDTLAQPLSGERSYVNACTIKHGSFGSPGRQKGLYYGAGSDDFCGYVWRIPDGLSDYRRTIDYSDWAAEPHGDATLVGFAKSTTGQRFVPQVLDKPQFLIYGHKSIINTVLFHPFEPYIVTAGIERHVLIHSPFGTTPHSQNWTRTETRIRQLPGKRCSPRRQSNLTSSPIASQIDQNDPDRADLNNADADDEFTDSGEENTVRYFDHILIREGVFTNASDIFELRASSSSSSESESETNSSEVSEGHETETNS